MGTRWKPHDLPILLDGRKFVAWLDTKDVLSNEYPDDNMRSKYLRGENLSVWTADKILTHLGYNINQIPIDVWIPHGNTSDERWDIQIKGQMEVCLSV